MIKSNAIVTRVVPDKKKRSAKKGGDGRYKRLKSMGRISTGIIGDMYTPIDSVNRFINLALNTIGEDAQTRHFLLESKEGIRKMLELLRKLYKCAGKLAKEDKEISQ
jgi:hypothetical protein